MKPDTIIFVANSPGEISGWMLPLVHEARRRWPNCHLVLQLMLCEFASGSEARIGREILGIEDILSPWQYIDMLLRRMAHYKNPVVIHLGGDMIYSALLARRWHIPLWIYVWGRKKLDDAFRGYLVRNQKDRDNLLKQEISASKIHIVGDLVYDATSISLAKQRQHRQLLESKNTPFNQTNSTTSEGPLLSFLPGSRKRELRCLAPFFLKIAKLIKAQIPQCRFQLLASPYIATRDLHSLVTAPPIDDIDGQRGHFDGNWLCDDYGTRIHIIHQDNLSYLEESDLAITVPGTKTSELGCLGVPMVTILPLNRPDLLPITGIIGLLDFIPYFGLKIKKWLVLRFATRSRLYALPNILAQRELVPEMVGVLDSSQVANKAISMINSPELLKEQKLALQQLYREYEGASSRILNVIEGNL